MYYKGRKLLSHNTLFNIIIGNRGGGKTFWCIDYHIKKFLKDKTQIIYLRRYDTEFNEGKKMKFFDNLIEHYPELDFKVDGYVGYINKEPFVYFCALSKGSTFKSVGFPNVGAIIYDEFIIDKKEHRRYLSDEVTSFYEFYETVARLRNNVRVFFLANAISMMNPYFLHWNIRGLENNKIKKFGKEIAVEMVANEEFIQAKKKTRFAEIIKGTDYEKYNIENKFLRDTDESFILKKTSKAYCRMTLSHKGVKYGCWIDYDIGKYFISNNIDPCCPLNFCVTFDDHKENTMLTKTASKSQGLKHLITNYQMGNVYFESILIKNRFLEIIKLLM